VFGFGENEGETVSSTWTCTKNTLTLQKSIVTRSTVPHNTNICPSSVDDTIIAFCAVDDEFDIEFKERFYKVFIHFQKRDQLIKLEKCFMYPPSLSWSPNSALLTIWCANAITLCKTMSLCRPQTLISYTFIVPCDSSIKSVVWSPDSTKLAVASHDPSTYVYDATCYF
jgi:WD40 repeat protein